MGGKRVAQAGALTIKGGSDLMIASGTTTERTVDVTAANVVVRREEGLFATSASPAREYIESELHIRFGGGKFGSRHVRSF